MVEGDADVRYLTLSDELYAGVHGLHLVGKDLAIFSAGSGDAGGTDGILEEFPTLHKVIRSDCDSNGAVLFRVIAIVDNDAAGRNLRNGLLQQYRSLRQNRDIFLLQRVMPRTTSEHAALGKQISQHNEQWRGLDCEIEDLLGEELINCFLADEPNALKKPPNRAGKHCHYEWTEGAKGRLFRFTKTYAELKDVEQLIELLQSLRFYLGLPIVGIA